MSDKFEWTDELVKEFASKLLVDRIGWAATHDCAAAPKPIPLYLQEFKKEKTHKEWEIMSSDNTPAILSVKRLSDGEVFSIGDEVEHFTGDYRNKIFGFTGLLNCGWFYFDEAKRNVKDLKNFKKVATPKPLFVTFDGKEVFEKDTWPIYKVDRFFELLQFSACDAANWDDARYYADKEKAKEYILMNKPLISLNEILSAWDGVTDGTQYSDAPLFLKMKWVAKQKLRK